MISAKPAPAARGRPRNVAAASSRPPHSGPNRASSHCRSTRAAAGLRPSVETPITRLPRRTIASALRRADLVLHDALPGRAVLRLVWPGATILAVGKRKGFAPMPQARIDARLVAGALAGLRVVRLKGGDPFLFGRGGEEAEALAAAGIPWRVVPGVTAGAAAPAAAGIPLTHQASPAPSPS